MREIFLTLTVHSFGLTTCTFVLLLNVHAIDNISSGWLIAFNLHFNSIESLLYMLHKWCTVIGAHMYYMGIILDWCTGCSSYKKILWQIFSFILFSTGWKTEGEFAFYRHMYSTYQEECWVSTSFSSQVGVISIRQEVNQNTISFIFQSF